MPGRVVRTRIYASTVTVTPSTDPDDPEETLQALGLATWDDVQIVIPDGHAYLTGIRLTYADVGVVPFNTPPAYLVGNDDDHTYPVDLDVTAPVLIEAYNTDIYPHAFHLRFKITDWTTPLTTTRPLLSANTIEDAR